jgi:hypothetical protein
MCSACERKVRILWCFSNSPPHSCLFFIDGDTCFAFLHRNRRRRKRSLSLAHFAAVIKGFTPCARDLYKKSQIQRATNHAKPICIGRQSSISPRARCSTIWPSREIPRLNEYMCVYIVSQLSAACRHTQTAVFLKQWGRLCNARSHWSYCARENSFSRNVVNNWLHN